MIRSVNGKWREVKTDGYRATVKRAVELAKRTGKSYFIYRDYDEYRTREQWQMISESHYHECFALPETWVKAFVGPSGVIETY